MTFIIPAVEKEAETQRCIPAVHSEFRSRIWESLLAVFCAVFAVSAQDSVCRNLIMYLCFLFGDVNPSCTPTAVNSCPVESLSNGNPRQFFNCCEYHRPSGHT